MVEEYRSAVPWHMCDAAVSSFLYAFFFALTIPLFVCLVFLFVFLYCLMLDFSPSQSVFKQTCIKKYKPRMKTLKQENRERQ